MLLLSHHVDGKPTGAAGVRAGDVCDPSTGRVIAQCPFATDGEVDAAVAAAAAAQIEWADLGAGRRARVLHRFRNLLATRSGELAETLCREQGKTLADGLAEIERGLDAVEFACAAPALSAGDCSFGVARDLDTYSLRVPIGVVVGITAFNFPVMLPLWLGALAIACGNAFVNKPSELAPSAALMLAELWTEAGLPPGIWNVLLGDASTAQALVVHPRVSAVSFIGSTAAGRHVYQLACARGKRAQAFCSAKNHMVIMPDADPEEVATALVSAGFGAAGQRCMAVSVAVPVGDRTADLVLDRLLPKVRNLRIGPYSAGEVDLGPLITRQARTRIEQMIEEGAEQGAHLLVDGRTVQVAGHEEGFFLGGTVFDRVRPASDLHKREIFGPVLSVVRCSSLDEAIDVVNHHEYGNGVSIYTRDGGAARRFVHAVNVGMIGVNVAIPVPVSFYSFAGSKQSRFGDGVINGTDAVCFLTALKTVTARWRPQDPDRAGAFLIPSAT